MTRRAGRSRRGATAIELALTAPLLVTVLGGVVELATMIGRSDAVVRAAHDAAAVGAGVIEGGTADGSAIEAAAEAHALVALQASGVSCGAGCTVTAAWTEDPATGLMVVEVSIAVPHEPFVKVGFPAAVLKGRAREATAQQAD